MTAYDELMAFQRVTEALGQIAGRLGWDQETVMPEGAVAQRAEERAAIEGVLHARRTDPKIGEWLAAAAAPDEVAAACLRHIRRTYERQLRVPARLATEIAQVTSLAHRTWAEARRTNDVALFLPLLSQVVALRREEAAALANGGDLYDALVEEYEPGTTGDQIAAVFDAMRPRLVALRERILGSSVSPATLTGDWPEAGQLALSRDLATAFGYDWSRGRLDLAVHPFSSGSGDDARITTRVVTTEPFNCFYSTIHEVGHACYELGISPDYRFTPLGEGVSMGVHESQSRIYENQLGRSRAFTGWLFDRMTTQFGRAPAADADAFYATVNRVQPGFIRTEADEVHYNLHIMLRFDLERQIVAGTLEAADLEEAWNARFKADFGVAVDVPANGVLQDVHWSEGLFGYFPTYSLGNVYAGCLHKAMRDSVTGIDAALARGDAGPATGWLRENLQRHGGLYQPRDVVARACGFDASEGPLLDYLEAKYAEIYRL